VLFFAPFSVPQLNHEEGVMGYYDIAITTFQKNYDDMLDRHKKYINPVLNSGSDKDDPYGAKCIHILMEHCSAQNIKKLNPDNAPLYEGVTVPMMYQHYWGNSACHYYGDQVIDMVIAATYHVSGRMDDDAVLRENPYIRYDALYCGLGFMAQQITQQDVKNKFIEQQQKIIDVVRADCALYSAVVQENGLSAHITERFNKFWDRSAYHPNNKITL
jgi:hypothetical protein